MEDNTSLIHYKQFKPIDQLVYLVSSNQSFGGHLAHQISHFGYYVQMVKDWYALQNSIAEHASVAVIVDVPSLGKNSAPDNIFEEIRATWQSTIPLMFVADHDDQADRLRAIRAGGIAFFRKPIDIVNLVDKLDSLQVPTLSDHHRVLIVEDQQPIASYYQMVLKMSGMDAEVVNDSPHFLAKMFDYHPDLILMDLYMPEVDGFELVKLIRQMDEFVSIPIVFLSSEDDFDRRLEAMRLGSDDFLTKPIKASHLVGLVKSRLERLRTLRAYMVRDSLTSLINHTTFRGMLAQEINRCRRQNGRLALAMLDLDHFKQINDTYGHSVGDSILKSLSRLLKQRLRNSDIIGRYGGEEFVALLLDTEAEQAFNVMEEIRSQFSEVEHHPTPKGAIHVTFSCGIATFPEYTSDKQLSDAADQAMYAAKRAGRNRVVIANP
jgi:diguanylate cyclase (GGDEF)-like protein